MSEFYRSSDNSGNEASQPAAETGPAARADHEPARDNAARQHQDNAAIEARLDEAGLPTRAEARAAALRPDADEEEDNEYDFSPESAAAIEARLDEAGLPTRSESRAAARLPDAADEDDDYDDDQAAEYNGVLGALTAEGHAPDTSTSDPDQTARDAQPGVVRPGDPSAEAPDSSAAVSAEKAGPGPVDADDRFAEMEARFGKRIAEMEARVAEQRKEIADLRAQLERSEQRNQERPAAPIPARELDVKESPKQKTKREGGRRLPSDTQLALGGQIASIALTHAA
jgi:uncharacterized coiled-coil protein SlyX